MSIQKITKSIKLGKYDLVLETGELAKQANGSVLVSLGDTKVLVTVVCSAEAAEGQDFFPLRVDYQERMYAGGKIPGGFIKREGRTSEREILVSRLIDRALRPSFPGQFFNEVQIIATVMSINPEIDPDWLAIIGASAAINISGIPFNGPIGVARVGYKDGCYLINPSVVELKESKLDLVVAGNNASILMVESGAKELSESVMLGAIMFGHKQLQDIINLIEEFSEMVHKPKIKWEMAKADDLELYQKISTEFGEKIKTCYTIKDKVMRLAELGRLKIEIIEHELAALVETDLSQKLNFSKEVARAFEKVSKDLVRKNVIKDKIRIDGRNLTTIRPISIQTGLLPRAHGSALFTRGETQAMVAVTLGTNKDAQLIDGLTGEGRETFMLNYNFLPFCVGEIGQIGSPKRREIGHGALAKRGVRVVLPLEKDFPYILRVVSEILESNGSSSMATVCGTSLALMDAGVPIKSAVAGIAMGLIKEANEFAILSDILGDEDHLGDMDFKVVGTSKGVTALQMDIKINGITEEIIAIALEQAREGRIHILSIMEQSINNPKVVSPYAPVILTMSINPEKIKDVIGKGGVTIRSLIEDPDSTSIDIQENGVVQIVAPNRELGENIKQKIEALTAEVTVGKIYVGKVVKILEFGAFVNILPNQDGLVHISQISNRRISNVADELSEGEEVKVKVLEIDKQGRLKLSIKACLLDSEVLLQEESKGI